MRGRAFFDRKIDRRLRPRRHSKTGERAHRSHGGEHDPPSRDGTSLHIHQRVSPRPCLIPAPTIGSGCSSMSSRMWSAPSTSRSTPGSWLPRQPTGRGCLSSTDSTDIELPTADVMVQTRERPRSGRCGPDRERPSRPGGAARRWVGHSRWNVCLVRGNRPRPDPDGPHPRNRRDQLGRQRRGRRDRASTRGGAQPSWPRRGPRARLIPLWSHRRWMVGSSRVRRPIDQVRQARGHGPSGRGCPPPRPAGVDSLGSQSCGRPGAPPTPCGFRGHAWV